MTKARKQAAVGARSKKMCCHCYIARAPAISRTLAVAGTPAAAGKSAVAGTSAAAGTPAEPGKLKEGTPSSHSLNKKARK